ncbi:peptidyl-tRNA hydrolase II [Coprinopsis marcescibilis]|uniref:peptidyl-tRNA hydrolase n=1 Tax=Coprinopsis marcescibilis TaxID=230819 RepID=A0A5C3KIR6_COPMA|nr:peptidyl-tRNA hydrolase II [Coprinopsis marcescibilis]
MQLDLDLAGYSALAAISLSIGFIAARLLNERSFTKPANDGIYSVTEDCKLVLVVRMDLKMGPGKIAAQCSHATLGCYRAMRSRNPVLLNHWERTGQTKVALRCPNEDELIALQKEAQRLNICVQTIRDAGRTQITAGSRTVLGILGPTRLVNQVTGMLRLL